MTSFKKTDHGSTTYNLIRVFKVRVKIQHNEIP